MKDVPAVILCGGLGKRLSEISEDLPKALVPIGGQPILKRAIESLKKCGVTRIILVVGYRKEKIKAYCGDGKAYGVSLEYFEEDTPLGTAGALYYLKDVLPDLFFVVYGDLLFDMDLERLLKFHKKTGAKITLTAHPNDHPHDSDILVLDGHNRVKRILKKNEKRTQYYSNCVNAGVIVLKKSTLNVLQENRFQDLEEDVVIPQIDQRGVFAYKTTEYIKDIGTPSRLRKAEQHLLDGTVARRNYTYPQKAIFLDRDGTINQLAGLINTPKELVLLEKADEAIRKINHSGYLAIVITNQPVIARNLCTDEELENIHRKLEMDLGEKEAYIDDLFYCPHHPDSGYLEENPQYKIPCTCRKPAPGLIHEAEKKHHIDLQKSYFIGDSWRDVAAGRAAKVKTILISSTRENQEKAKPDFTAENLLEAVELIFSPCLV